MEISFSFQWWKNFENRLRFDEVTTMSLVAPFWNTVFSGSFGFCLESAKIKKTSIKAVVDAHPSFCWDSVSKGQCNNHQKKIEDNRR